MQSWLKDSDGSIGSGDGCDQYFITAMNDGANDDNTHTSSNST